MALIKCPECNKEMSSKAGACPSCGFAKPKRRSYGCGTLLVVGAIGFSLIGLLNPLASTNNATTIQPKIATPPPKKLTESELLTENETQLSNIKKRLSDNEIKLKNYYATKNQLTQAAADTATLSAIKIKYSAKGSSAEEKKLSQQTNQLISQIEILRREMFASATEEAYIKNGINMAVSANGQGKTTLKIKYALMSKAMIYSMRNEANIDESAKTLGFTKMICTNGLESDLGQTWVIDLK